MKASNTLGVGFGYSVALSGDASTLAVGDVFETSVARGVNGDQTTTGANASGATYIYRAN